MMVDRSALLQKNPVNNPWCRKANEVNVETSLHPLHGARSRIRVKFQFFGILAQMFSAEYFILLHKKVM